LDSSSGTVDFYAKLKYVSQMAHAQYLADIYLTLNTSGMQLKKEKI